MISGRLRISHLSVRSLRPGRSVTPKGSVVTGPCLPHWRDRGLPTASPAGCRLVLDRGSRCGLRRYERVCTARSPSRGARCPISYPTRNFATLGPFLTLRVATRLDHIFTRLRDRFTCLAYG